MKTPDQLNQEQGTEEGRAHESMYNHEPHLTLDTIWESDKTLENITDKTHESQEASPFPAGDRKEQTREHNKDKHETK